MCVIQTGDISAEVWRESWRKARKQWRCDSCSTAIQPGVRYLSHFSVTEGNPTSEALCAVCFIARAEFCNAHGGFLWSPGSFEIILADCVSEDDESRETWEPMLLGIHNRREAAEASA